MVLQPSGAPMNMCSWEALVQMLRFLKRGFWPAAWDFEDSQAAPGAWTGGSGFMGAAQVLETPLKLLSWRLASNMGRAVWGARPWTWMVPCVLAVEKCAAIRSHAEVMWGLPSDKGRPMILLSLLQGSGDLLRHGQQPAARCTAKHLCATHASRQWQIITCESVPQKRSRDQAGVHTTHDHGFAVVP